MPKAQPLFQRIIALLEKQYGRPRPPRVTSFSPLRGLAECFPISASKSFAALRKSR